MAEKSYKKRGYLIDFLIIISVPICWIVLDIYQTSKHSLPKDVETLQSFAEKMPKPKEVHFFEKNNENFIEVIANLPDFPATPSGEPRYIFDQKGQIVFWTVDCGDSNSYWEDWGKQRNSLRTISLQEALELSSKNNQ